MLPSTQKEANIFIFIVFSFFHLKEVSTQNEISLKQGKISKTVEIIKDLLRKRCNNLCRTKKKKLLRRSVINEKSPLMNLVTPTVKLHYASILSQRDDSQLKKKKILKDFCLGTRNSKPISHDRGVPHILKCIKSLSMDLHFKLNPHRPSVYCQICPYISLSIYD